MLFIKFIAKQRDTLACVNWDEVKEALSSQPRTLEISVYDKILDGEVLFTIVRWIVIADTMISR